MKSYHIQLTPEERTQLETLKKVYGVKAISKVIKILIKEKFIK